MSLFGLFNKKRLQMVWKVKRQGLEQSYLVGTAHFFPYSLKSSIKNLLDQADTILLEGPLDQESMEEVVRHGYRQNAIPSLYDALGPEAVNMILRELAPIGNESSSFLRYGGLFQEKINDPWTTMLKGAKPWMTFFAIWTCFLGQRGWKHSIDREAYKMAITLSKKTHFLETIEEQIDALEGVPLDRIVTFLKKIKDWRAYPDQMIKSYLKGDYEGMMSRTTEFPTRCSSIIETRDPVLFERMTPFLETGRAVVFIGISHIRGVSQLLTEAGFSVEREWGEKE